MAMSFLRIQKWTIVCSDKTGILDWVQDRVPTSKGGWKFQADIRSEA
jgi:hypothetical protein